MDTLSLVAPEQPLPETIEIRPYQPGDSLGEITELLHRAYADLARPGMNFVATDQDEATTASRIAPGSCFVALRGLDIVGTITLYRPEPHEGCEWYSREGVFHFGQYGVEPSLQGCGIGWRLLEAAETLAVSEGARELSLDTSEQASELLELYARWGFRLVGHVQWEGRNYRSVLLSKSLS